MFRETLAVNTCVSATRWQRGSTVSAPVLRSTVGGPSPSPQPPSSPALRKGDKRSKGDPVPASFNDAASIRSPLSRRAGAGLGVRVVPHLPLSPFLSPTKRGRENVGAGEKERWKPEFDPILSERWETRGLARKNAGNPSRHSHTGTVRAQ